jgi:hypothetical protein
MWRICLSPFIDMSNTENGEVILMWSVTVTGYFRKRSCTGKHELGTMKELVAYPYLGQFRVENLFF